MSVSSNFAIPINFVPDLTKLNDTLKVTEELDKLWENVGKQVGDLAYKTAPDYIKAVVQGEKQILELKKQQKELMDAERRKQGTLIDGQKMMDSFKKKGIGGVFDDMKAMLSGPNGLMANLKNINPNQLLGSGIMGLAQGGLKGLGSNLLGSVAGAAAGPLGALIAAAPQLASTMGKFHGIAFKKIADGLNSITGALQNMTSGIGPVGSVLDVFTMPGESLKNSMVGQTPIVGDYISSLVDSFNALPNAIKGTISMLTEFAGVASPGTMTLFKDALQDIKGIIGQTFLPFLNLMREFAKLVGGIFATILPPMGEVQALLGPLRVVFNEFAQSIREFFGENRELFRAGFRTAITGIANLISAMLRLGTAAVRMAAMLLRAASWLGAGASGAVAAAAAGSAADFGSAVGAAARPASITDSASYRSSLLTAAFSSGIGSVDEQIADNTAQTNSTLNNILDWLDTNLGPLAPLLTGSISNEQLGALGDYANQINESIFNAVTFGFFED